MIPKTRFKRLAAQIINPNLLDFIPLEEDYRVMDVAPPDSFYGHTLTELDLSHLHDFLMFSLPFPSPPIFGERVRVRGNRK
jgi:trk system potassium uptake protein TrkA